MPPVAKIAEVETGLNDRSAIGAQLSELSARVDAAEKAVKQFSAVDADLYARMSDRLNDEFRDLRRELVNLDDELSDGVPLPNCWERLGEVRSRADVLFGDCLAFIHGALTRSVDVDGGLCRIADHFLKGLGNAARVDWDSLTVLAESEFYENLAQIVRIRFAETSIWSLPIAVHEFGHFVGPAIKVEEQEKRRWRYDHPLQRILDEELARGENDWARMHEYMADTFATYSLGPAYVYTCVLLRFDPADPNREFRHPSDAKRVWLMLETLGKMNEADEYERPYSVILEEIEAVWRSSVAAAGGTLEADRETALKDSRFDEVYDLFEDAVPDTKYSSFSRADRLRTELDPQQRDGPRVRAEDTIPDILNAAWLCRVEHWDTSAETIGKKAVAACLQIVDGEDQ